MDRARAFGDEPGGREALRVGRAGAGRPGQVYGVDQRPPAPATRLSGAAKR